MLGRTKARSMVTVEPIVHIVTSSACSSKGVATNKSEFACGYRISFKLISVAVRAVEHRAPPRLLSARRGLGLGHLSRAPRASSLSCGPRKRVPHLPPLLVRPPPLSRVGALGIRADAVGMLDARPLPRPTSQFVMQLTMQLPPSFAASALLVLPIVAVPVARCAGAGDCRHLGEQVDSQRRNL
jgi:hypothetical protein